jgi:N,N'-diacetyllegionaminate synthase
MKKYIIAEIGSNFDQKKHKIFKMITEAKKCGADAVKFQLFKAKLLYPNDKKMFKLFKSIELNPLWIKEISEYCNNIKIDFLTSVFDLESAKFANRYVKFHKVASSEATNIPLLKYLLKTKKKILYSTGMCDEKDIKIFLNLAKKYKNNDIVIMQCGSMYPLPDKYVNLNVLNSFKKFKFEIGFSDHTLDYEAAMCASSMGATYFEKHFTLNKKSRGPDHFFALEPHQLKKYVSKINRAKILLGTNVKEMLPDEKKYARRDGLYFKKDLKKNTTIKKNHLLKLRPSLGIRARDIDEVIGKKLTKDVKKLNPVYSSNLI